MSSPAILRWSLVLLGLLLTPRAFAQNATTPGTLSTPHPTLENISVKWEISGDDNQSGVVSVN